MHDDVGDTFGDVRGQGLMCLRNVIPSLKVKTLVIYSEVEAPQVDAFGEDVSP
jgi:hypothetical protein